jgi:hypothetical protein
MYLPTTRASEVTATNIHFHTSEPSNIECSHGYFDTLHQLRIRNDGDLHTTQLTLLHPELLKNGHRLFVSTIYNGEFEIRLGINDRTRRWIHTDHNLLKLLLAGEFGSME